VLWLERPPYLRWLAAAVLVTVAAWVELGPEPTMPVWFATDAIPAGTALTPDRFTRREVAWVGSAPARPEGVASVDIAAGDPLVPSLRAEVVVPAGWMAVAAPLPPDAVTGSDATLVILPGVAGQAAAAVPALVLRPAGDDAFGNGSGTVAVPPDRVTEVLVAAADDRLAAAVVVGAPGGDR
jgi:hypothetical protein